MGRNPWQTGCLLLVALYDTKVEYVSAILSPALQGLNPSQTSCHMQLGTIAPLAADTMCQRCPPPTTMDVGFDFWGAIQVLFNTRQLRAVVQHTTVVHENV